MVGCPDGDVGVVAIAERVERGWLRRLHRGVYLVGALESPLTAPAAAILGTGPNGVLSHRTAATLWSLLDAGTQDPVEITLLNANRRARREAQVLRLVTREELDRMLTRPHRGVRALRAALDDDPGITRSEAERRLLALIRAAGLPAPQTNVQVAGHEVDLYWPEHRLVVEFDGWAYHSTRAAFERDRLRDADLQLAGQRVVRVTHRQVGRPERLIARLAGALSDIRPGARPLVN